MRDDDGGHGEELLRKITGIGPGNMISNFGGWEKETEGRRLTKPKRERQCVRFKTTCRIPEHYALKRRVLCWR